MTILALVALVILCGFISYYGDLQGRRWGKKRVSLFGLRPKHTAILITSITGGVIALVSIGTVMIAVPSIREVIWNGERAIRENKSLNNRLIQQRIDSNNRLNDIQAQLALERGSIQA